MITRQDYMNDKTPGAHRRYYGQFVTPGVLAMVGRRIGVERIKASTDPNLTDIPLALWDGLHPMVKDLCIREVCKVSAGHSLSDSVCIAKEAARQLAERP